MNFSQAKRWGAFLVLAMVAVLFLPRSVPEGLCFSFGNKKKEMPKVSESEKGSDAGKPAAGQNVEKLMSTLNETLEENHRIRQSMRDLQAAFEKVTLEKGDLVAEIQKSQRATIQRDRSDGRRIDDLSARLENSQKAIEALQRINKSTVEK